MKKKILLLAFVSISITKVQAWNSNDCVLKLESNALVETYYQKGDYEKEFNINTDIPMSPKKSTTTTTKVTETPKTSEIKVFPNPTDGNLTVFIPKLPEGNVTFHLFDVMGRNIFSVPLTDNYSKINLSAFSQGIYYYQLINNGIIIKSNKVVKQ